MFRFLRIASRSAVLALVAGATLQLPATVRTGADGGVGSSGLDVDLGLGASDDGGGGLLGGLLGRKHRN